MVIKATIIKVLFAEMYVNVVFVIRWLYRAMSLTLVKEYRFYKNYLLLLILLFFCVHRDRTDYYARGAQGGHFGFHTALSGMNAS